ncbi:tRNA (adenosine(37)-N6)-threonylcarbamoyltransferase complex ATPase subunit type 1 TsaE [Arcobacter lacus]|uniref:tRNA threonylcarbamoyladenosine biosynthesis protein TsaE n=1 Tax=Arcobacter lacus TaxID=1912876 RepID=A0ABX5JE62_9BACT|nr:tRNA (adenosine(37)-N6)-threonylcarbamoyltransferase complex ATPase subunit type 1 TsaE [Arcobacter lacus]MCT7908854.1 tRNA (adenosine(37)-N6)-threonylcarbamoyltransferase complex ATPase subunit type 1 TsaE [Arcobacter lacus]MCT7911130.1 tRNA (adenosine(37)-N6)-threonylcarbamoyltransferase complex ATPase subunit type 1 TsaE [Arcobacter lacus]PUE64519.1 tRNA (adenosine(37)-N6)-threonylcarbamoyltransferase complex ATPase subunit type 1 TsaE [Arcobacter lacus]
MKKEFELDLDSVDVVVDELKKVINNKNCVVILRGDLASGKTTLVKNYVKALGLDDLVTSPTFSIQAVYSNNIFHYDVYNKTLQQFICLGMIEEFEAEGIHFVEWGDEKLEDILKDYGFQVVLVEIRKKDDKRLYTIDA